MPVECVCVLLDYLNRNKYNSFFLFFFLSGTVHAVPVSLTGLFCFLVNIYENCHKECVVKYAHISLTVLGKLGCVKTLLALILVAVVKKKKEQLTIITE